VKVQNVYSEHRLRPMTRAI